MLNDVLGFLSMFDWISPLAAKIEDLIQGPHFTFFIPEQCGRSARLISQLLRQHGIRPWGLMIVNHHILITVRQAQAQWAEYVLDRAGVPLETRPSALSATKPGMIQQTKQAHCSFSGSPRRAATFIQSAKSSCRQVSGAIARIAGFFS